MNVNLPRVLVADDEPSMRTTMADVLSDSGFDVQTANDGLAAVALCEQESFDVVLMDVRMPGIDGIEAFRRVREAQGNVRVILMSAYGDEAMKYAALQDGAIAFLDKPLNLDVVIRLITDSTRLSILAVTGDDQLTERLPTVARSVGQQLHVVRTTEEATSLLRQVDFEVALIDAELPDGDGLQCYLALRDIHSTLTAIMISSADRDLMGLAEEAVRRTAYTVVNKPLQAETLAEVIAQLQAQRISGAIRKPNTEE